CRSGRVLLIVTFLRPPAPTLFPYTTLFRSNQPQESWRWQQEDIERVQEFRKCIECFLCQDVCHVLRNHETERPFMGPRFLVRSADRKSTRLNSSHVSISYAVCCLKKKNQVQ